MWQEILLFTRRNIFVFELLFSYAAFLPVLKPRKFVWLRLAASAAVCVAASYFIPHYLTDVSVAAGAAYTIFWYFVIAAISIACLKFCYTDSVWNVLFCGISAYAAQHIFYRLKTFVAIMFFHYGVQIEWLNYVYYWACMALVGIFCFFAFTRRIMKERDFKANNKKLLLISVAVLLVAVVLSHVGAMYTGNYFRVELPIFIIITVFAVVCCLLLLDNLFSNVDNKKLADEVRIIQSLWRSDRKQYEISKQNIDLLNVKYHDLKYRIADYIKDEKSLAEVTRGLNVYESIFKTKNEVLDVVLTEKKLQCDSLGIKFACIADGELLGGMETGDLYSLFGNALDNAIECLVKVQDEDKKTINVTVKRFNESARILVENYVPAPPRTSGDGLPLTTKANTRDHGFGLKSISYIVKKYKGVLRVGTDENMFRVDIMLPLAK